MLSDAFIRCFRRQFPYDLTPKQEEVVASIYQFLYSDDNLSLYILRGYAGTGKTQIVSALVRVLKSLDRAVVLLAPTGRAAKVFSLSSGAPAYTVHKQIYRRRTLASEESRFDLAPNTCRDTLFIVDESSMLSAHDSMDSIFGSGNVLHDLLHYVYRAKGCRIMFVGDNAQLPPVGDAASPALQPAYFTELGFHVSGFQLTEVLRQAAGSGVLANATMLRQLISEADVSVPPKISLQGYDDISCPLGDEIVEMLQRSYELVGQEQTIVLTRSNKQANAYNLGIRSQLLGREGNLQRGDMVMVVRNNYYWPEQLAVTLKNQKSPITVPMDFIANGDIAEVTHYEQDYEIYGLHFADVTLSFPDYDGFEMPHVRVLLDTLTSDGPALSAEKSHQLFQGVSEDYADERNKQERMKQIRQDPNYNALQIKYAYAVTCHKAQGGQWRHVYLDQGWLPPDGVDVTYYRWLYTAFTRPTGRLYLLSWPEEQMQECICFHDEDGI